MVLDELHVLQRGTRPIGERHAIAGLNVGICGEAEDAAAAPSAQDYGFSDDRLNAARGEFDGRIAPNRAMSSVFPFEPLIALSCPGKWPAIPAVQLPEFSQDVAVLVDPELFHV